MEEFLADPLSEREREIFEYMKKFLVGLSYAEARTILSQLMNEIQNASIISE